MDQNKIEAEAKEIMDSFMDSMSDIEVEEEFVLERKSCLRDEVDSYEVDEDFRQRFLANANKTSGDAVLANKGNWVENK